MKIVGITGSSGSGKSTLGAILNKREDVELIDADKIVKKMSVPGEEYLKAIEKNFRTRNFFRRWKIKSKSFGKQNI